MFVGKYGEIEEEKQSKNGLQVTQWYWHCDRIRQESPVGARAPPGPALWALVESTDSTRGFSSTNIMVKYNNTFHNCTVTASILLSTGLVCGKAVVLFKIKHNVILFFIVFLHQSKDFVRFVKVIWKKNPVLSSADKAVYGTVGKSRHNHGRPLLHVALKENRKKSFCVLAAVTVLIDPAEVGGVQM